MVVLGQLEPNGKIKPLASHQAKLPTVPLGGLLSIWTQNLINVTPAADNDGTITLKLDLSSSLRLVGLQDGSTEGTLLEPGEGIKATAKIRDGETFGIYGLTTRFLEMNTDEKTPASNMVVLVTAHILK